MSNRTITFQLHPTEDQEITCICCGFRKCDLEFVTLGDGRQTAIGCHIACADKLESRQASSAERRAATLEKSLRFVALFKSADGTPCWCGLAKFEGPGAGVVHAPWCVEARESLA